MRDCLIGTTTTPHEWYIEQNLVWTYNVAKGKKKETGILCFVVTLKKIILFSYISNVELAGRVFLYIFYFVYLKKCL